VVVWKTRGKTAEAGRLDAL